VIEVLIAWLVFIAMLSTFALLAICAAAMPFVILGILIRMVGK